MPNVGLSFSPTNAVGPFGANGQPSRPITSPVMDAIKILSFRKRACLTLSR
jgi:hypothetical protein